jgi:hypothetical protein
MTFNDLLNDPRLTWDGAAITKTAITAAIKHCEQHGVQTILETGSGMSTIFFADYARDTGATVTSLEHSRKWYDRNRALLDDLGLLEYVDLRYAPIGGDGFFSAKLTGTYDFVLVDGIGTHRGRELPRLMDNGNLSDDFVIWLHDGNRDSEKRIIERWKKACGVTAELKPIDERGVYVVTP